MLRIDTVKKARARKQAGFIVTGELLLIAVVLVIGLVTGMTKLRDQTLAELSDTGSAIGAINQSYSVVGTTWANASSTTPLAQVSGFAFLDAADNGANGSGVGGDGWQVVYNTLPTPSSVQDNSGENGPK